MSFLNALERFSKKPRPQEDVQRAFARCFNTAEGKIVLEHLHQTTLFRVLDPLTPVEQMRFFEGQRQLVLFLCQCAAKGRALSPSSQTL